MKIFFGRSNAFSGVFLLFFCTVGMPAVAQQTKVELRELNKTIVTLDTHYAAGSIQSLATAEEALSETSFAQEDLQVWYMQMERDCYEKFFVNYCLNEGKMILRNHTVLLQRIIVEAKALQRRQHIEQLDESRRVKNLEK
ncbi:hypothetical protein BH11PSE12_BH11PSE12_16710 [soil metagenome]